MRMGVIRAPRSLDDLGSITQLAKRLRAFLCDDGDTPGQKLNLLRDKYCRLCLSFHIEFHQKNHRVRLN
jgi:hypothetical protein